MIYEIEVKQQGSPMARHIIEAADALPAINRVERWYSDPVQYETVLIEDEHSHGHHVMLAHNWHGYTFEARVITPSASNKQVSIQPVDHPVQHRALSLIHDLCS
jgi:hypothetical protein